MQIIHSFRKRFADLDRYSSCGTWSTVTAEDQSYFCFGRSNYADYSLESRLHFRVHVALNKVSELEKESK